MSMTKDGRMQVGRWLVVMLLALLPFAAGAAKLGNLTIFSALDQPLRAEIEVVAAEDEIASLVARLVHLDNLSSERSENALVTAGIRFTVERRQSGEPFLRVATERPVKEQFIDMFVEIVSARGKRVHGYSFLLDAPRPYESPAATPVAVPEVKKEAPAPVAAPKPVEPAAAGEPVAAPKEVVQPEAQPPQLPAPAQEKPAVQPAEAPRTRLVVKGDTLGKIARETKAEDVTLFQMLVALLRGNGQAFIEGNMNRLMAGKLLSIPDRDTAITIDKAEAKDIVVTQAAEFDAYRQRLAAVLAAAPAKDEGGAKVAEAGKGKPSAEEKLRPAPTSGRDKLEISRTGAPKAGAKGGAATAEEDRIASEKALNEANSRIAELEKNLADLKKLAALTQQGGGKDVGSAAADAAKLSLPAAPPVAKPVQTPPSFVEEYGMVAGAVGILVLLLGYLRRRSASAKDSH